MTATILGQPCWDKEKVQQFLLEEVGIARTAENLVDYFLASHAPVDNIRRDATGEEFDEVSLFETLFSSTGEVQMVIHGDPGTGKSHLIYWLKLRTEDALSQRKIKKIKPVLIRRRKGTLKDALEQMIEQLGEDFKHYLSPVQKALSDISSETAREILVNNIGIELLPQQRIGRKREPLPPLLRDLPDVCSGSKGFRNWLCRVNGVCDAVVKHLTEKRLSEAGDVIVADKLPQFTPAEFSPDAIYRGLQDNTRNVRLLLDEFDEDPELVERAVKFFNEVLPDAIKKMTGLSGTNLRDIFDSIRVDLKKSGETLAIFIEDVSTMAVLDEEVFAAVEPQSRKDMCRMIAVVGTTEEVWSRIPANQRQRVTHPISLGKKTGADWQSDAQAVAKFAARYLNTVRLKREEINAVAAHRRNGGDVNLSDCDKCPVREECHAKFGKTQIGAVEVGLFPFSTIAPHRLLNDLSSKSVVQKNARGLLTEVLLPVLDRNYENLQTGKFPNPNKFAVVRHQPVFWGPFKEKYCSGWSEQDIKRLEFLAQGWATADTADELATQLAPFLAPFNFREFSKRATAKPKTVTIGEVPKPRETPRAAEPTVNPRLNKILQSLRNWINGEKLEEDVEIRKLLAEFVRSSIVWEDVTSPPLEVWKNVIGGANDYAFVEIEGQFHSPQATYVKFQRDEDTRNLIEALAQFRYAGNRSWNFDYGEFHKRIIAQWLRRHQSEIIEQIQPPNELDTNAPIASAVQILSTAALVRQRAKLPPELSELIALILADNWTEEPFALSKEWESLATDMKLKHKEVLRFLFNELNVPQGRSVNVNFINAIPALNAALEFAAAPKIQIPSEDYFKKFWISRYAIFQNKGKYANFTTALHAERAAVGEAVESIGLNLSRLEYDTENLPEAMAIFCADLIELVKEQTAANEPYPNHPFMDLGGARFVANRKDVWQTAVKRAQSVIGDEDPTQILTFNPQNLKEAEDAVSKAFDYISRVENYVVERLQTFEREGDPDLLAAAIRNSLENIEQMRS